jgi:hypothetical protein
MGAGGVGVLLTVISSTSHSSSIGSDCCEFCAVKVKGLHTESSKYLSTEIFGPFGSIRRDESPARHLASHVYRPGKGLTQGMRPGHSQPPV